LNQQRIPTTINNLFQNPFSKCGVSDVVHVHNSSLQFIAI